MRIIKEMGKTRLVAFDSFKARREALELTRDELAKKSKVKADVIGRLEDGIQDQDVDVVDVVAKVKKALGMTWREVFA